MTLSHQILHCSHLNLLHGEVKECEIASHGNHRLWSLTSHGRPKASVELDHHQLVQHVPHLVRGGLPQSVVVFYRGLRQLLDLVPVHRWTLLSKEPRIQPSKAIKLLLNLLRGKNRIVRSTFIYLIRKITMWKFCIFFYFQIFKFLITFRNCILTLKINNTTTYRLACLLGGGEQRPKLMLQLNLCVPLGQLLELPWPRGHALVTAQLEPETKVSTPHPLQAVDTQQVPPREIEEAVQMFQSATLWGNYLLIHLSFI